MRSGTREQSNPNKQCLRVCLPLLLRHPKTRCSTWSKQEMDAIDRVIRGESARSWRNEQEMGTADIHWRGPTFYNGRARTGGSDGANVWATREENCRVTDAGIWLSYVVVDDMQWAIRWYESCLCHSLSEDLLTI